MNKVLAILGGLGAGAAAMYFMDPERGRGRRAMIRDKAIGLSNDVRHGVAGRATDLTNRAKGLMHNGRALTQGQGSTVNEQAEQPF